MLPTHDYFFLDELGPEEFMRIVDATPSIERFTDLDESRMHICVPKRNCDV